MRCHGYIHVEDDDVKISANIDNVARSTVRFCIRQPFDDGAVTIHMKAEDAKQLRDELTTILGWLEDARNEPGLVSLESGIMP